MPTWLQIALAIVPAIAAVLAVGRMCGRNEERLDTINTTMDKVEQHLQQHAKEHNEVDKAVALLRRDVDDLDENQKIHHSRIGRLKERLDRANIEDLMDSRPGD